MLDHQSGNLLIVEDDDVLRERLARAMVRRGYDVRTASSVSEAQETIALQAPEFAIVDLRLDDGSGLEVVRDLEAEHPDARAVILTGYGDIPTAVSAARLGAVDYVAKPATADEIVDVLTTPKGEATPMPDNPTLPDQARIEHIEQVFNEAGRNVSHTARLLQMHRRTLQRLLRKHEIPTDEQEP
jgi:two-component system response regulator RegA